MEPGQEFLIRVSLERGRQQKIWGNTHDDNLNPTEWSGVLLHVAGKVAHANEDGMYDERKRRLIQLAATCLAEYEAIERRGVAVTGVNDG